MNINILRALIRSCLFWHDYNFSLFEGYPSCVFYSLFSKTSDTRDSKPRLTFKCRGSGCGSVGRAVASDTRGPRFEYSHQQLLFNQYFLWTLCRKDENKEKEDGNGPFKKLNVTCVTHANFVVWNTLFWTPIGLPINVTKLAIFENCWWQIFFQIESKYKLACMSISKNWFGYFRGIFEIICTTFYFNILSRYHTAIQNFK